MKQFIITLLVLIGIAAVGVVSCPEKQAHKDAIMSLVNSKLNKEFQDDDESLTMLGVSLVSPVIGAVLDNYLEVKNCFVFSLGQLQKKDGPKTISVGIFGHVFTISKEEFEKAFDQASKELF